MRRASPAAPVETDVSEDSGTVEAPAESGSGKAGASPSQALPAALPMWSTRSDVLMVGFWALLATCLGRALAPALPGSSAGIGELIVGVEQLAAFSTQFTLMLGAATCVRLLISTLECRLHLFRPVALVTCAAALPVILSASSRHLSPDWLIALVGLSSALALASLFPALRARHSRAAGLVLLGVTSGSLVSAGGRILALYASQQVHAGLFGMARGVATAGFLVDALTIAVVTLWIGRRLRHGALIALALLVTSIALSWAATQGQATEPWRVVVGRALAALTAHPDPLVGPAIRYVFEVLAILLAMVVIWLRWPLGVGAALAFALLGRASGDVPLCALMLMLSALSAVRASLEPEEPSQIAAESSGRRASLEVVAATR